jgi:hypothetical protein
VIKIDAAVVNVNKTSSLALGITGIGIKPPGWRVGPLTVKPNVAVGADTRSAQGSIAGAWELLKTLTSTMPSML